VKIRVLEYKDIHNQYLQTLAEMTRKRNAELHLQALHKGNLERLERARYFNDLRGQKVDVYV
jgi:hypothetical protein